MNRVMVTSLQLRHGRLGRVAQFTLSHTAHLVKSIVTFCILALLLTACSHIRPEKRSTEAEIRQHIVGEWTFDNGSDGRWFPKMILAEDGSFTGIRADGTCALLGSWECQGTMLKVTRTVASDADARASAMLLNNWDYLPVIYADEHHLVMTGGISVAGRMRFTR